MIKELTHSRFTPSLLTHQALEAIFVRREDLAERLVDSIRESATTGNKHFILLHGPRGIGKTHLVSLVHGRIEGDAELSDQLRIAWLYEEEWGVASYVDLLRVILRALHEKYEDRELATANEKLLEFSVEKAELEAEKLVLDFVGHRTLLILTENVDEIFDGLEEKGQKQLRALIQNNPVFTIVATARGLFEGVEQRESPFYGFFNLLPLDEFSADDATELLRKLAQQEGDLELEALLDQRQGRARIRALHYLAGGNPRVYVIFSQFLTRESLDSLVAAVMNTLDDLTSYYQERMARLTPQQRKIIQFLCDQPGASTVKVIAGSNFITHQTTSSQLKKLREIGYVRSEQRGRESYYEIKEPLMRIALGVKKHRGEPLALLVEFLRIWYTHDELKSRLELLAPDMTIEKTYLDRAMQAQRECLDDPIFAASHKEFMRQIDLEDFESAFEIVEDICLIRNSAADWTKRALCFLHMGNNTEAIESLRQALIVGSKDKLLLKTIALLFSTLGCDDEVLMSYERCIEIDSSDSNSWRARGTILLELDRVSEALESFDKAIELDPNRNGTWYSRAIALSNIGRHEEALTSLDMALKLGDNDAAIQSKHKVAKLAESATSKPRKWEPRNADIWFRRGLALSKLGRPKEAIVSLKKATELAPLEIDFWMLLAFELLKLNCYEDSLVSIERVTELAPDEVLAWGLRGAILWELGRLDDARSALHHRAELSKSEATPWKALAEAQSVLGYQEDALIAYDKAIEIDANCMNFSGLSRRAVAVMLSGRWDDGLADLNIALGYLSENHGLDPDDEVGIVGNMLLRTREHSIWRKHFVVWVELFHKHGLLSFLGQGLVHSIQKFQVPWLDQNAKRTWYKVWSDVAADHKEMSLPLRLLKAAVDYHEEKDDRVLFQLPIEEKRLLEPLLGIKN